MNAGWQAGQLHGSNRPAPPWFPEKTTNIIMWKRSGSLWFDGGKHGHGRVKALLMFNLLLLFPTAKKKKNLSWFSSTISSSCSLHSDYWLKINTTEVCQVSGGGSGEISSLPSVSGALLPFTWLLKPASASSVRLPRCQAVMAETIQLCMGGGEGTQRSAVFMAVRKTQTPEQRRRSGASGQQHFKGYFHPDRSVFQMEGVR